jgi:hypothetical protein
MVSLARPVDTTTSVRYNLSGAVNRRLIGDNRMKVATI